MLNARFCQIDQAAEDLVKQAQGVRLKTSSQKAQERRRCGNQNGARGAVGTPAGRRGADVVEPF